MQKIPPTAQLAPSHPPLPPVRASTIYQYMSVELTSNPKPKPSSSVNTGLELTPAIWPVCGLYIIVSYSYLWSIYSVRSTYSFLSVDFGLWEKAAGANLRTSEQELDQHLLRPGHHWSRYVTPPWSSSVSLTRLCCPQ